MKTLEVLIVEDNIKVSRTHQAFVEKVEGFTVTGIASSLSEARLLLDTLEPDLILLDIYFGESNGIEFLKELRATRNAADVILVTAAREVEMLHSALQGGAFDYMIKPVFFERFRESLDNYRKYKDQLAKAGTLSQEEADRLFRKAAPTTAGQCDDMPKGIDTVTLDAVIGVFNKGARPALSATEVGEEIGISRTTARKYLEYLIAKGLLAIHLDYGTKGRPERRYRLESGT
jgi:two-component system, CitB family, response regulator